MSYIINFFNFQIDSFYAREHQHKNMSPTKLDFYAMLYIDQPFTVCSSAPEAIFARAIERTISIVTVGIVMAIISPGIAFVDILKSLQKKYKEYFAIFHKYMVLLP